MMLRTMSKSQNILNVAKLYDDRQSLDLCRDDKMDILQSQHFDGLNEEERDVDVPAKEEEKERENNPSATTTIPPSTTTTTSMKR